MLRLLVLARHLTRSADVDIATEGAQAVRLSVRHRPHLLWLQNGRGEQRLSSVIIDGQAILLQQIVRHPHLVLVGRWQSFLAHFFCLDETANN